MLRRIGMLLLCVGSLSWAALVRVEVATRSDVLDGKSFGNAGPYERITGKAYFAVDPALAANQIITDIDKAPRTDGKVEFSSDFYVLKPRDPKAGNGAVLFEVSNRGRKGMLSMYNRAAGATDPQTGDQFGDGFLMEQGYTLVWLGWQFDVPADDPGLMHLYAPVIKGITGVVRSEILVDKRETSRTLGDRNTFIAYPVVNPDDPKLTLTVRDSRDGKRQPVPRSQWHIEDRTRVVMPAGFEPGRIYELVYTSQDPAVVGLGPAAIRDFLSFLKYGGPEFTLFADQHQYLKRIYGYGVSQSGRFLRTFLYYGFNADEKGRQVLDGVLAHVAGAGRGSFNIRFGQPSRDGHPFMNTYYPTDIFPFTDEPESDPETGLTDGLMVRADKAGVTPKIFYTNSSYEYWGRAASLIHTSPDGKQDAQIPAHTRIYFFAGGQHGPAAFPPKRNGTANLPDPNPYTWSMRALLVAMNDWVKDGKEPPPSQYPRVGEDKLVGLGAVQFPKIPGVSLPSHIETSRRADFGPEFRTKGIISIEPAKLGNPFNVLLPQVDRDGNETSGIRMPEVQVPLATYAGWNMRAPEIGGPGEMYSMVGSFIPFPRTVAERNQKHDPRPSIQERYASRAEYLDRIDAAAKKLAAAGYLLQRDVPKVVEHSREEWDWLQ